MSWKKLNLDANDFEASFEFKPEQTITGRLADIDGQAAAGVHVQIAGIMTRVSGDQFPEEGVGFLDCPKTPAAWPQPIVADDQGRFTVHGVSKDDGISLDVDGNDRFAPQSISLNTGMAEQRGERDGTYRPLVKNLKPGEEGVLPLAPAQLFTGTVRFEDTGEPAPKSAAHDLGKPAKLWVDDICRRESRRQRPVQNQPESGRSFRRHGLSA